MRPRRSWRLRGRRPSTWPCTRRWPARPTRGPGSSIELAGRLGATGDRWPPAPRRATPVLARVAAREGLPFAANCTRVTPGDPGHGDPSQRWGGSLLEEAAIRADRAVLTVAPHALVAEAVGGAAIRRGVHPGDGRCGPRRPGRAPDPTATKAGVSLAEARVVVSGGRGVGLHRRLRADRGARLAPGRAVGCSRAVTISGWRSHTAQVGQTGTKIAPELYIAAGISGATQHMAGCKASRRSSRSTRIPRRRS